MKHFFAILALMVAMLVTSPTFAAGDFSLGKKAYEAKDYAQALVHFTRAADANDAGAQLWLGSMFRTGIGVKQDNAAGLDWLRKSADNGNAEAAYRLGDWYTNDGHKTEWGITFLIQAGEQNHKKALRDLAWHANYAIEKGQRIERSLQNWISDQAANGHVENQHRLSQMYFKGLGVDKNPRTATIWMNRAAEGGHTDAQIAMSQIYFSGTEVQKSGEKAFYWLNQAAKADHPEALTRVGLVYARSENASAPDRAKGFDMIMTAARMGYTEAQYYAGEQYAAGQGVEKSLQKALMWFHIAQKNGVEAAQGAADFHLQKNGFRAGSTPFLNALSSAKDCWNNNYEYYCGEYGHLVSKETRKKYRELLSWRPQVRNSETSYLTQPEIWE